MLNILLAFSLHTVLWMYSTILPENLTRNHCYEVVLFEARCERVYLTGTLALEGFRDKKMWSSRLSWSIWWDCGQPGTHEAVSKLLLSSSILLAVVSLSLSSEKFIKYTHGNIRDFNTFSSSLFDNFLHTNNVLIKSTLLLPIHFTHLLFPTTSPLSSVICFFISFC